MTQPDQAASASWTEPEGLNPRGTVIVVPGRGEEPVVYERFGRRLSVDAYRVHAITNPVDDPATAEAQVKSLLDGPAPVVLAGSDTGALFAAGLVASGRFPEIAALILAGLPVAAPATAAGPAGAGSTGADADGEAGGSAAVADSEDAANGDGAADSDGAGDGWEAELAARTACPTHRGKLAGGIVRRGALYQPVPDGWAEQADLKAVPVPVLGLHGAADPVSPLADARERYAAAPRAELVSITGGVHDAFNDITHRTAAATVILFLERLRNSPDLAPIAVQESL